MMAATRSGDNARGRWRWRRAPAATGRRGRSPTSAEVAIETGVMVIGIPERRFSPPERRRSMKGSAVVTIEGLSGPVADAVREAWVRLDVPQCGYCQSGQVMAAAALLARQPKPAPGEIDAALANHLCRCATYQRIRAGVQAASAMLG